MNHLRKFELETDYLQAKDSFVYPNVSYIVEKDILHYMKNSKYDFVDLGLIYGRALSTCPPPEFLVCHLRAF